MRGFAFSWTVNSSLVLLLSAAWMALPGGGCTANRGRAVAVAPTGETLPVQSLDDAADDAAIWIHPTQPERSLILGTDKQSGLAVYDLSGSLTQFLPVGRVNNVDLRQGIRTASGATVDIVAASHRDAPGISLFVIERTGDTATLRELPGSPLRTKLNDPYGLCVGRPLAANGIDIYVNDKEGVIEQWRVSFAPDLTLNPELLRTLKLSSQLEGLVCDDEQGVVFVGEEAKGVWRFSADASSKQPPVLIAAVGREALRADVEGLTIADTGGGNGYLIVSSQGDDSFALFGRRPPHAYAGSFRVEGMGGTPGGAEETDGIDVTTKNLGAKYPGGLFVAQDGKNGRRPQNFKLVRWDTILQSVHGASAAADTRP